MTRHFEFVGKDVIVRYGLIGTDGQTLTKNFISPEAARRHFETLIDQKRAKGYVECATA